MSKAVIYNPQGNDIIELKPCPFCGSKEPYLHTSEESDGHVHYENSYVICPRCGARTKALITREYYGIKHRPEEVIEFWNMRFNE